MTTGVTRVPSPSNPRTYSDHGGLPARKVIQRIQPIEIVISGPQRRETVLNLAADKSSPYKEAASSFDTIPFSTPHLTQTWARGPTPWMNCSRLKVPLQTLQSGIFLPYCKPAWIDYSTSRFRQEGIEYRIAQFWAHRLRVNLYPMNLKIWMRQAHYFIVRPSWFSQNSFLSFND